MLHPPMSQSFLDIRTFSHFVEVHVCLQLPWELSFGGFKDKTIRLFHEDVLMCSCLIQPGNLLCWFKGQNHPTFAC